MGKKILWPGFYVSGQAMDASWEGPILHTQGLEQLSFIAAWTGAASPTGELQLWGSNDPRAEADAARGHAMAAGQAQWKQLKLPEGSVDADGTTATFTGGDDGVAITGVGAGRAAINVVDIYAFMKLVYASGGGGVGDTINVTREGNG